MNIKIACFKKMKRTTKVAQGVADALQIDLLDIEELENISETDVLILVGGGESSGENKSGIEGCVKKIGYNKVKYAAIITLDSNWDNTSVASVYNISGSQVLLKKILEEKEIHILGEHMCESQFKIFAFGHPNKKDITKSVEWVEEIIKSYK